jgi:hypothetical protein
MTAPPTANLELRPVLGHAVVVPAQEVPSIGAVAPRWRHRGIGRRA